MKEKDVIEIIKTGEISELEELLDENPKLAESYDEEMKASALLVAVYYGRGEFVDRMLKTNLALSIWESAATGKLEMVKSQLKDTPDLVNKYSEDGYFPLGLAAFFGYPEVVEILIKHGADVNLHSSNAMKVFAMNAAAAFRDVEKSLKMMKMLIESGADVNAAQHGGITALHAAAAHGHVEKAKVLMEAGAEAAFKADDGRTALDMAREGGYEELVALLGG